MRTNKLLAAAALAAIASGVQAQNLVSNGSFEATAQGHGTWSTYATLRGGWASSGGIELRNDLAGIAQAGDNFVELDTSKNSSVSESILTGAGTYELSFWYLARPGVEAGSNGLKFSFGSLTGRVLLDDAGGAHDNWQHYTGLVTLTGPTLLASMAIRKSDSYGGSPDNISVTAAPEPKTHAMLLAGLGMMGVVARRRLRQS